MMIQRFLKAKHWQLFLFMFVIPFVLQMILMILVMSSLMMSFDNPNPEPSDILQAFQSFYTIIPVVILLNLIFYFGWFWSIGVGLQKYVPSDIKLKVNRFKMSIIFPLVYITLFSVGMATLLGSIMESDPESFRLTILSIVAFAFPLHLLSMFCMFYNIYFTAKTLKTIELQREAKFGDYIKEALLLWFYPIGVWILQPQINKIVSVENKLHNNPIDS